MAIGNPFYDKLAQALRDNRHTGGHGTKTITETKIAAIEKRLDNDTLTAAELQVLQADLKKLKEQLK